MLSAAASGTAISLAGCLGGNSDGQTVRISGGVGPLPMVQVWADLYAEQSDLTFDISGGGTGVGVSDAGAAAGDVESKVTLLGVEVGPHLYHRQRADAAGNPHRLAAIVSAETAGKRNCGAGGCRAQYRSS